VVIEDRSSEEECRGLTGGIVIRDVVSVEGKYEAKEETANQGGI